MKEFSQLYCISYVMYFIKRMLITYENIIYVWIEGQFSPKPVYVQKVLG